jgi:hypothetical protein
MALFAVGILAQALLSHSSPHIANGLDAHLVIKLAESSLTLMADADKKVAVTAVRATGCFACLVLQHRDYLEASAVGFRAVAYLEGVVQSIVQNVRAAVSLALCTGLGHLSWKQRSGIKKQGWGACNALANLFKHDISKEASGCARICQEAVSCLMNCAEHVSSLNEKVAISALAALQSIDRISLSRILLDATTAGYALESCFVFLFDECNFRVMNPYLLLEVKAFLAHVLPCVSALDVKHMIQSDALTSRLGQLYLWMVEQDCPLATFACIAVALQTWGVCIDMQVEQQFFNRAMCRGTQFQNDQLDEL